MQILKKQPREKSIFELSFYATINWQQILK